MNDMKKMQKARAEALGAALDVMAKAGRASGAERIELDPENVLRYAKFILGKRPAKKKRRKARPDATGHLNIRDGRAYWAPAGEPLPNPYAPWKPMGFAFPGEDAIAKPFVNVADLFRKAPAETAPQPLTLTAMDLDRAVRDLREKARRGDLAADPAPVKAADGIDLRGTRTRWDAERNVERGVYPAMPGVRHEDADVSQLDEGNAAGCEDCAAELERRGLTDLNVPDPEETSSPVGEDPGDREVLTQWAETIRQQDAAREAAREAAALEAEPAEKAPREGLSASWAPRWHVPDASTNAPDHVVRQGASLGCPECTVELTARWEKEARNKEVKKEEGRRKLASRINLRGPLRTGPLDEDELLAVAGKELYPAGDNEPPRELKIRNRKGEVQTHTTDGWTMTPGNPWRLGHAWTSSEMVRRGPWHVV